MTTNKQYYLSCDTCGKIYTERGRVEYGEESQCVKDMAIDSGWFCDKDVKGDRLLDFCSKECFNHIDEELGFEKK